MSLPQPKHEKARQNMCTGVATAMTILSIIIVGMRTYSRFMIVRNFGRDDWMMLVALLFTIGYLIMIWFLRSNGMGFSGTVLTPEEMTNIVKTTIAIEILYYISILAIKASILFFYLRIAVKRSFELGCKITIYVLALFCGICVICCLVQCVPLHKMWDFTGLVQGKCINTTALFYFTSSFNILTDIWILALPIQTLVSIQRPNREKLALVIIFGLGIFSCIASIVRLRSIRIYTNSKDPFYDSVPINIWSMVELNIGIYCASIPAIKAICTRTQHGNNPATRYIYRDRDSNRKPGQHSNSTKMDGTSSTRSMPGEFDMKTMDSQETMRYPEPLENRRPDSILNSEENESRESIIHSIQVRADNRV